jgi:hypothetical protein
VGLTYVSVCLCGKVLTCAVWNELRNRRKFFETYARRNDFNPLIPENWYSIDIERVVSEKVGIEHNCFSLIYYTRDS